MTASFCRNCGKQLNEEEKAIPGNVLCGVCAPGQATGAQAGSNPYTASPTGTSYGSQPGQPVPGLAFALGLIPGVGAIYNAQYAKGLIHAVIFGILVSASDSASSTEDGFFSMLVVGFIFYMAFEAYHTAQRRLRGQIVDEFSSIVPRQGAGFPVGPVVLIGAGVFFLLNNMGWLSMAQIVKYSPAGLIVLGVYLLYVRLIGTNEAPAEPEVRHE
jgi:hypothetical protein